MNELINFLKTGLPYKKYMGKDSTYLLQDLIRPPHDIEDYKTGYLAWHTKSVQIFIHQESNAVCGFEFLPGKQILNADSYNWINHLWDLSIEELETIIKENNIHAHRWIPTAEWDGSGNFYWFPDSFIRIMFETERNNMIPKKIQRPKKYFVHIVDMVAPADMWNIPYEPF